MINLGLERERGEMINSGLGSDEENCRDVRTSDVSVGQKGQADKGSFWGKNIRHTSGLRGGMHRQRDKGASEEKEAAGVTGNVDEIRQRMYQMLLTSPIRTRPMEDTDGEGSCIFWGGMSEGPTRRVSRREPFRKHCRKK